MEVVILASGSGGNCIAVRSGSTVILIDAGIPKTKIERRLLDAGIRPDEVAGIFLTHAHRDHIQGLALANKYRIPVNAGEDEWKDVDCVDDELRHSIETMDPIPCRDLMVYAFQIYHDAYEPFGYVVIEHKLTGDTKMSICLDTGKVEQNMLNVMHGSDIYIIEANHDPDMLAASDYPESVKKRILGPNGHLSNQQAAEALAKLVQGRGERIYLTHLSRTNNLPVLARMTVEAELRRKGFENGTHYHLEVV